jgi:hypothetical protein
MLQLIYISSVRPGLVASDIDDILAVSRRRNGVDRVTGLLVHDGRRFLQALEGEAALVEAAYARIRADGRHRAIVTLSQREVAAREFGNWAMAAHQAGAGADKASLAKAVDRLVADIPDANTRELFRGFARIERKAA